MVSTVGSQAVGTNVVSTISGLTVCSNVVSAIRGQTVGTDVVSTIGSLAVCTNVVSAIRGQTICTDMVSTIGSLAVVTYTVGAISGQTVRTDVVSTIGSLTIRTGVRCISVRRAAFSDNSTVQYRVIIRNGQSECTRCQNGKTKAKQKVRSFHDVCSIKVQ
jgi:hypothetical protein